MPIVSEGEILYNGMSLRKCLIPTLCLMTSCSYLENDHCNSIYTIEMGKCYKSGLPSTCTLPVIKHLLAHQHLIGIL